MIGGTKTITTIAGDQLLLLVSGQLFFSVGGTQVVDVRLLVDGGQVAFQSLQIPATISVEDGYDFSFVWLTGALAGTSHTVDIQALPGSGGANSLGGSGSLYFQSQ